MTFEGVIRAVREGLSGLNDNEVRTIVVFRSTGTADDAVDQVPAACRNGHSLVGICNAYSAPEAFAAVVSGDRSYFRCEDGQTAACPYDPENRRDGPTSDDVETIGVYVRIETSGYTGLFAESWSIQRAATARLEPGVLEG